MESMIRSSHRGLAKGPSASRAFLVSFLWVSLCSYWTSSSAQVIPGDPAAIPVEFMFSHELAEDDSGVGINGNMNGWGDVYKMRESEPGLWKRILELKRGVYEYKFVTYVDTIGQSGVTGWFTDPLNPNFGGPFNNSFITVKDPMIYYFLPRSGTTISQTRPQISAKIAVANSSQLDAGRIELLQDGAPVADAAGFYDPASKTLNYVPAQELSFASHTFALKVFNTAGDSATASTTFTITNEIVSAPYTFMFDSKSPNFKFIGEVNHVDVKGSFNFEGLDPMSDDDGDGVYTVTKDLQVNSTSEYTVIINGGSYINDPDNPNLSLNHRTQVRKRIDPRPRFGHFAPVPGSVFLSPLANLTITGHLSPSDSGYAIVESSLAATLDGVNVPVVSTAVTSGFDVSLDITNATEGRHIVEFFGADFRGNAAWPAKYVFGAYPTDDGFHYVDGEDDDKGIGTYKYPSGVPAGSADIRAIHIAATPGLDSLEFTIELEKISPFTRVGLEILNSLDGERVDAPQPIDLKVPDWDDRGAHAVLADPQSTFLNTAVDNLLLVSRDPVRDTISVEVNADAAATNQFRFRLPLSALEEVLGNFNERWYFGVYSYLKDQNGTVEVGAQQGGENFAEDPDVYDVAFFSEQIVQERLLVNYIVIFRTGGPRIAVIATEERGFIGVDPTDIHPQLGQAPAVRILAGGGELLQEPVTIVGVVDGPPGTNVTLKVNETTHGLITDAGGKFAATVNLTEGENRIVAEVPYGAGLLSRSRSITYNYIVDHSPQVGIITSLTQGTVTLDAGSSIDPDGTGLSYSWTQDPRNPEVVFLSSAAEAVVSFPVPQTSGEYYFRLTAADADQDSAWARTVVAVHDSGAFVPDYETWHPSWVDSAVVYEVFVRTFSPVGKFRALTGRMQELADLGITCIWLMPIHPTTGNLGPDNPGYAITDYLDVLEQYGTKEDFRALVQVAHQHGIRVILDHVIQHTSALHPFMLDANVYKQDSPYYPFYLWKQNNNFDYLFTWVDLPSINYEAESTQDYLLRMAKYWVQEFDIDGYRCDVAWAINDLRPSGAAYWQRWRQELKAIKPDIFLLAEANAQQNLNYYDGKFDSAYDWPWISNLRNLLTGAGSIADLDATTSFYQNHPFPNHARPFRFLENHDEQRFFQAFGLEKTRLAAALLLTAPGIPMLYAGQEVGEEAFRGVIRWNDPNQLRPHYKNLIRIRKNNPGLSLGDYERLVTTAPNDVYSYLRTYGTNDVIVNLNFSGAPVVVNLSVPLEKIAFDSTATFYLNDELNHISYHVKGSELQDYQMTLPAYGAQVLVLSNSPITGVAQGDGSLPLRFSLAQNYPNPFNPATTIKFVVGGEKNVATRLHVFNVLGQRVKTLIDEVKNPGLHTVVWDGKDDHGHAVASGVYFYILSSADFKSVKKMLFMK